MNIEFLLALLAILVFFSVIFFVGNKYQQEDRDQRQARDESE